MYISGGWRWWSGDQIPSFRPTRNFSEPSFFAGLSHYQVGNGKQEFNELINRSINQGGEEKGFISWVGWQWRRWRQGCLGSWRRCWRRGRTAPICYPLSRHSPPSTPTILRRPAATSSPQSSSVPSPSIITSSMHPSPPSRHLSLATLCFYFLSIYTYHDRRNWWLIMWPISSCCILLRRWIQSRRRSMPWPNVATSKYSVNIGKGKKI